MFATLQYVKLGQPNEFHSPPHNAGPVFCLCSDGAKCIVYLTAKSCCLLGTHLCFAKPCQRIGVGKTEGHVHSDYT
jgi:hypothetical protein